MCLFKESSSAGTKISTFFSSFQMKLADSPSKSACMAYSEQHSLKWQIVPSTILLSATPTGARNPNP